MARNWLGRLTGQPESGPKTVSPYVEQGVSGTPIYGGYIRETEKNARLTGASRYRLASDILTNTSIVAAGMRHFLNLCAKPKWKIEPADDTDAAKEVAEFVEEVLFGMATSWSRQIRRAAMFKYHGFGIHEWTAVKRDDGRIGMKDIESRPQHTIQRWGVDENGAVTGVWQRSPQTGQEIWLPRSKVVYMVDDAMTDNPEGMGWFRSFADPADRLKNYLELETIGYERNLSGTPIGRVPYAEINSAVAKGIITQAKADEMISSVTDFVEIQKKKPTTSLTIDSVPYLNTTEQGQTYSPTLKWGVELLTSDLKGIEHLAAAIERENRAMARVMGIEGMLLGSDSKGSHALSKDKSESLYLNINSTIGDMAEAYDRDAIGPIIDLNGIPDKLRPTAKAEDVSFKDVTELAAMLRDMATAGAVLSPNDPAVNDMRDLAGLPHAPEMTPEELGYISPGLPGAKAPPEPMAEPNKPAPDANANAANSAKPKPGKGGAK